LNPHAAASSQAAYCNPYFFLLSSRVFRLIPSISAARVIL
jgi:hypothetical protein